MNFKTPIPHNEFIEISDSTDIMERITKAYYEEKLGYLSPKGIILGPTELYQFYVASTLLQNTPSPATLLRPTSVLGLPIHVSNRPGIAFLYPEEDASALMCRQIMEEKNGK